MAQQTVIIGDSGQQMVDKLDNNFDELYAAQLAEDNQLIEWAGGKDVEKLARNLDADGRLLDCNLKWPDASTGTFTATDYNATHELYDGWTMSHTASGKTVTQAAVTRNSEGIVTTKPVLTVA